MGYNRVIEPTIWNLGCSKKNDISRFWLMAILLRHGFGGLIWHTFGISWGYLWLGVSWISFHVSDIFLGSELHISETTKRSVTWIVVWTNQVRLNMLIFAVYPKNAILKVTIIINHVSQTNPCERLLNWMFDEWVGQGIGVKGSNEIDPLLCILFLICHAETSWQTRKNSKDLL